MTATAPVTGPKSSARPSCRAGGSSAATSRSRSSPGRLWSTIHSFGDNKSFSQRGLHYGGRIAADLWWEPTQATMISMSLYASTIANGYGVRVAPGWRLTDTFWVGPEASISADYFSTQYRLGAHLTGLTTGAFEWSLAAGYVQDSFGRGGAYGRISVLTRR